MSVLRIALEDSPPVLLRPVAPEDRERLQKGLALMSPDSRYLRFFGPIGRLSKEQLGYFTEVDQQNHVAWVALDASSPELRGLGIARFIRLQEDAAIAETALAVIDAFQRRGLGTALLAILYLMAQVRGIRVLRAVALAENRVITQWFHRLGAVGPRYRQGVVEFDLPVHADPALQSRTPTAQHFATMLKRLEAELELAHLHPPV